MVPPAVQSLTRLATKLVIHHSVDYRATEPASRGAVEQSRCGAVMPSSSQAVIKTLNRQAAKRVQLEEWARQGTVEPSSWQPLNRLAFGQSTDEPLNQ
jgi:hypothetical protein